MFFVALSSPLVVPPVMVVSVMLCLIVLMLLLLQRLTMGIVLHTKMKFPTVYCIRHKAVIPLVNS